MKRTTAPDGITVQAVLEYARQLRCQADAAVTRDPHCELYRPSNDVARKVSAQLGPQEALTELARRARVSELAYRDEETRSEEASTRHLAHQLAAAGERAADRDRLTLGQRLDDALRAIAITADAPVAQIDGDRVSTSKSSGAAPPSRRDRRRTILLDDVRIAVERIEQEAEHGRRRMVELRAA